MAKAVNRAYEEIPPGISGSKEAPLFGEIRSDNHTVLADFEAHRDTAASTSAQDQHRKKTNQQDRSDLKHLSFLRLCILMITLHFINLQLTNRA